jgi:hypothetical protein
MANHNLKMHKEVKQLESIFGRTNPNCGTRQLSVVGANVPYGELLHLSHFRRGLDRQNAGYLWVHGLAKGPLRNNR